MIPQQFPVSETPRQTWRRWLGEIFIPERHIGIVYQDGRFSRFLPPGFNPRLRRWDEQLVATIPISFHNTESTVSIRSSDGFTFHAGISTRFSFNPGLASPDRQSLMAEIAVRQDKNTVINKLMEREVESGIVILCGEYASEQLMAGNTRTQLERQLKRHIKAVLVASGLVLAESTGLLIRNLEPPASLTQLHLSNYTRNQAVQMLSKIAPELRPIDLLDQMIKQGKASFHMYDAHFSRTLQHYYAQVFTAPSQKESTMPYEEVFGAVPSRPSTKNTNGHLS